MTRAKKSRQRGLRAAARAPDLGPREMEALEQLWDAGSLSAQQLRNRLPSAAVSLSTVQSTLERLHRKRLAERTKSGRAYVYRASMPRSSLISLLLGDLVRDVGGGNMAPMISGFVEFAAGDDPAMRAALTRLLRREDADDA